MNITGKDIIEMPIDKLDGFNKKMSSLTNSRTFNKNEERELMSQVLSFSNMLHKCGNGHIIPPEIKPLIKDFEKCNFDIRKLPRNLQESLRSTYFDLRGVIGEKSAEFKGTSAETYCRIYEFFGDARNLRFIDRIRKDPVMKKSGISTEAYFSLEALEEWISTDQSEEAFGVGTIGAVKAAANGIAGLSTAATSQIGGVAASVAGAKTAIVTLGVIVAILMVAVLALVVVMMIINAKYKSELHEILRNITSDDVKNAGGPQGSRRRNAAIAAKAMWDKTSPLTKNVMYKPMGNVVSSLSNLSSKGYHSMDGMLKTAARFKGSRESYSPEESREIAVVAALGATIPVFIIVAVILLIMMIKPAVYAIYNLKLKLHQFFQEEADLLNMNVENLTGDLEYAPTEQERKRIQKIIDKQKNTAARMANWANIFYKVTNDAAMDARDDIRENDAQNYDAVIDQYEGIPAGYEATPQYPINDASEPPQQYTPPPEQPSYGGNAGPMVLF